MDERILTTQFIALSRYAGSRFDLVQASGGNTSVKLDDERMLIKASGFLLSELEPGKGGAVVDYPGIVNILKTADQWRDFTKRNRDAEVANQVGLATKTFSSGDRASIEVFLHAVLGRFVLHTHPIAVNIITSQSNWDKNLIDLFPDALCVPYRTPGIELGLELAARLSEFRLSNDRNPQLIFLQNHGLLVSAETADEVQKITEHIVVKCEAWCGVDLERYRKVTDIGEYIGGGVIAFLSEDRVLTDLLQNNKELFSQKPFYPDSFVFCGVLPLAIENLTDTQALETYRLTYQNSPKVINYRGRLYFIAKNIKKAKEIEEVYKAHILVLASMKERINFLSEDELAYLGNWEAEKYRREK
jgi:rhamnose utilization protein RhaD (predicted bifunctional aldolase and dehydrogenase)